MRPRHRASHGSAHPGVTGISLTTYATTIFRPTGAATLDNGDVVVLERRFTVIGGVAARLRLLKNVATGNLEGKVIAELIPPVSVDNMEGIAVRRDPSGNYLIYLLSDDNFFPVQRTLLLIFELTLD